MLSIWKLFLFNLIIMAATRVNRLSETSTEFLTVWKSQPLQNRFYHSHLPGTHKMTKAVSWIFLDLIQNFRRVLLWVDIQKFLTPMIGVYTLKSRTFKVRRVCLIFSRFHSCFHTSFNYFLGPSHLSCNLQRSRSVDELNSPQVECIKKDSGTPTLRASRSNQHIAKAVTPRRLDASPDR